MGKPTLIILARSGTAMLPLYMAASALLFFIALLSYDAFRFAVYNRRISNYAQIAAQTAARRVFITEDGITLAPPQETCQIVREVVRDNFRAEDAFWDGDYIKFVRQRGGIEVICAVSQQNLLEVSVRAPFRPTFVSLLPRDLRGYARARLISGITTED